jgi:hypothetical protein
MRISLVLALGLAPIVTFGCSTRSDPAESVQLPASEMAIPRASEGSHGFEKTWSDMVQAVIAGVETELDCHFPVNDQQLAELPESVYLEVLLLEQGVLTKSGVERIAGITSLRRLGLRDCCFGDEEATLVASMPKLSVLNVPNSQLTNRGLQELGHSKSLISLRVGTDAPVDQMGACLQGFRELRHLHLIGIEVDQVALEVLVQLPELQTLYLDDAGLSDEEVDWLVAHGEHLHIHLDQVHPDRMGSRGSNSH